MLKFHKRGFTVVELLIVIVVIGILAGLTIVGYNGVQLRGANAVTKADAANAADQIELAFLKAGKFPLAESDLSSYKKDPNTDWDYSANTSGTAYCLEVWSLKAGSKRFTVRDDKALNEGTCTGWVPSGGAAPATPTATIASLSTTSISLSWPAATGATSYSVKYGTASPSTAASCSTSPCTVSGLAMNTTYYLNVTATNTTGSSTSSTVSGLTRIPNPTTASVTYVKSTVKYGAFDTRRRYDMTASGSTCSIGTLQWQINASAVGPNYGSWAWSTSNTNTAEFAENGQYSPDDITVYATPRCVSGSNISEGDTATAISGTGGAVL